MGMLVSQTKNSNTSYFLQDAQGSTVALADSGGAVTSSYSYDAFGNLDDSATLETNYLYTGQQYDATTDLYSLRARYHDTETGRFLTRDTWAYDYQNPFELNRYVYTANNPATYIDPSGYSLVGNLKLWGNAVTSQGGLNRFIVQPMIDGAISGVFGHFVGLGVLSAIEATLSNMFFSNNSWGQEFSATFMRHLRDGNLGVNLGLSIFSGILASMLGSFQEFKLTQALSRINVPSVLPRIPQANRSLRFYQNAVRRNFTQHVETVFSQSTLVVSAKNTLATMIGNLDSQGTLVDDILEFLVSFVINVGDAAISSFFSLGVDALDHRFNFPDIPLGAFKLKSSSVIAGITDGISNGMATFLHRINSEVFFYSP